MKKRVQAGFALSLALTAAAAGVLMLRLADPYTRPAALVLYGLGWIAFLFALRRHRRSLVAVERTRRRLEGALRAGFRPGLTLAALAAVGYALWVLVPPDRAVFLGLPEPEVRARSTATSPISRFASPGSTARSPRSCRWSGDRP